ncbi:threonine/serine exporter family protein [Prolixibacter denitrificans]|jgi:uncharacterized membrane protein YjjB (DUF3815 family)|uniref:Uncharacterized membrane protein YjjB (DUF3815 family) n=1 Tax=Prolixibacter denitrificans TaxID=1541063 RepID=A0A2P8CBG9_9BACT|nr:threonine/serine exporter family protein [Prolixibacter denitrificans]PSK82319.1 uncharacterized membrane protein YjjB (DUF3815 family) [Prolixibacter denitrificans]GET22935.1 hypothetical protein JCM18694_31810 [Prolixibacter denitrificans]
MTELYHFMEMGVWLGFAAIGFAVLFNVPQRALPVIWLVGALGGITKLVILHFGGNIILASLAGATLVGFLSIPAAHSKHAPPLVFSIPAVIPMVPGAFAYRMMLGLIRLAGDTHADSYSDILNSAVSNGLKTLFILLSLAAGVAIPMLVTRKESAKKMKIIK